MSSEPSAAAEDKGRKRKSFTKFMTKVKNGLTSSKIKGKRQSMMSVGDNQAAEDEDLPGPSTVTEGDSVRGTPTAAPASGEPEIANPVFALAPAAASASALYPTGNGQPLKSALDERQLAIARTKMLFEKYNFDFDPDAYIFTPPRTTERVNKAVRLRVHRRCHRCNTVFGNELACSSCSHRRCKKCPRYPGAGSTSFGGIQQPIFSDAVLQRRSNVRAVANGPPQRSLLDDPEYRIAMTASLFAKYNLDFHQEDYIFSMPQQGRVEKRIRLRVHRQCHRCNATFGADRQCPHCTHSRCKKCMRLRPQNVDRELKADFRCQGNAPPRRSIHDDPDYRLERIRAVFNKYNFTFEPGDYAHAESTSIGPRVDKGARQRVHRQCHKCMTPMGSSECDTCGHRLCTRCPRDPPKRAVRADKGRAAKGPVGISVAAGSGTAVPIDPAARIGSNRVQAKPKLRVKRYCHECNDPFPSKANVCRRCQHEQCTDCKRLPVTKAPKPRTLDAAETSKTGSPAVATTAVAAAGEEAAEPGYLTAIGQKIGLLGVD